MHRLSSHKGMDALKSDFLLRLGQNQALKSIYFEINLFYWGLLQWRGEGGIGCWTPKCRGQHVSSVQVCVPSWAVKYLQRRDRRRTTLWSRAETEVARDMWSLDPGSEQTLICFSVLEASQETYCCLFARKTVQKHLLLNCFLKKRK